MFAPVQEKQHNERFKFIGKSLKGRISISFNANFIYDFKVNIFSAQSKVSDTATVISSIFRLEDCFISKTRLATKFIKLHWSEELNRLKKCSTLLFLYWRYTRTCWVWMKLLNEILLSRFYWFATWNKSCCNGLELFTQKYILLLKSDEKRRQLKVSGQTKNHIL